MTRLLRLRLLCGFLCVLCDAVYLVKGQNSVCSSGSCLGETGHLRPSQLPAPLTFQDWGPENSTWTLPGGPQQVAEGAIGHFGDKSARNVSSFAVLPGVVPRSTIDQMLALLESPAAGAFDRDPDTVDGMPTYEMFIDSFDLSNGKPSDRDPHSFAARRPLREKLKALTQPILNAYLTPFVRQRFPAACGKGPGRACTPCYSLVRRYRRGERQVHGQHHDGHALTTVGKDVVAVTAMLKLEMNPQRHGTTAPNIVEREDYPPRQH
mmetsp:Transcript_62315/g.140933  ORF Transcript_62315/g.140933 Transcript_62315/m.140933 type:complete len:265 (-) Transcript_62315:1256-2050(-)